MIEQARLERVEGGVFGGEEVRLGLACYFAAARVAVEGVTGDRLVGWGRAERVGSERA